MSRSINTDQQTNKQTFEFVDLFLQLLDSVFGVAYPSLRLQHAVNAKTN